MKHPFDYHSPSATQIAQIQEVREGCKALHSILLGLPSCRERSTAITKLEEVSMWANKGIIMVDEGPVEPAPVAPVAPVATSNGDIAAPWGTGYAPVQDPKDATHVYEPSIGVQTKDKPYPRSLQLRWLKAL